MTRTIINPNDEEYYSNSWLFNNKPFLSKDIKDYQDKDQEWKDKATDLLSNIVNM